MIRNSVGFIVLSLLVSCGIAGCGESQHQSRSTDHGGVSDATSHTKSVTESAMDFSEAPAADSWSSEPAAAMLGAEGADESTGSSSETSPKHADSFVERDRTLKEERFVPNSGRQSGILTAGSFDDVAQFADYLSFLRRSQRQTSRCNLPLPPNAQQTIITVTDCHGKPLGDVRCVVKQPGTGQTEHVLLDMHTGTDGRVMLLSDAGGRHPQQAPQLRLQLYLDDQQTAVVDEYREVDCHWSVAVQDTVSALPTQLDLALVVDTTGSMGDELEYLKTEIGKH